jgi:hypothetical protein
MDAKGGAQRAEERTFQHKGQEVAHRLAHGRTGFSSLRAKTCIILRELLNNRSRMAWVDGLRGFG